MEPKSVLLADDDVGYGKIMREFLEEAGHEVTWVKNGRELLDTLAEGGFDIVLSDVDMPSKTGPQALHEARTRGDQTPFILMTDSIVAVWEELDEVSEYSPTVWEKNRGSIAAFIKEHID